MTDHFLHLAAKIAIHVWPPLEAKRRVDAIASLFPAVEFDEAERMARRLRGGSCLSRALVIASRLPGAEIVIGAKPPRGGSLEAHAWVEAAHGMRIGFDGTRTEIARLK